MWPFTARFLLPINSSQLGPGLEWIALCPSEISFRDTERLVLAGWNFEGLRDGILAGLINKRL